MNPRLSLLKPIFDIEEDDPSSSFIFTFENGQLNTTGYTDDNTTKEYNIRQQSLLLFFQHVLGVGFTLDREDPKYLWDCEAGKRILSFRLFYPEGILQVEHNDRLDTESISDNISEYLRKTFKVS